MYKEKTIFVTNDDGYESKGFRTAIDIARRFGRVIAVAPEHPQSGKSQAITIYDPLFLKNIEDSTSVRIYSLSGTPVDCVKVAFDHLLKEQNVDLVISGVNHGSNAAVNTLYSGTMGAAIEGSFYAPAVGLSLDDHSPDADMEAAERIGASIVGKLLAAEPQKGMCLNVNIPAIPLDCIRGIRLCRQTRGYWREEFFRGTDPHDREYFWLTGAFVNAEPDADDTDEWALAHGYAAVVPVQVDMTDYRRMAAVREILEL